MSLINDALNKVQRQRREKLTPEEMQRRYTAMLTSGDGSCKT